VAGRGYGYNVGLHFGTPTSELPALNMLGGARVALVTMLESPALNTWGNALVQCWNHQP